MHVLVIGGTRFVGYQLVWRLLAGGHRVTIFNRGTLPDPFGERVERLRGDRTTDDFARLLAGRRFDATVDFAAHTAADATGVVETLGERAGHYVFISTGQVYLVRQDCPRPAREEDYDGPLLPEPTDPSDRDEWRYGVEKRQAEDILTVAWRERGFPSTRLRLPMVNGERDHFRRIESYLWRLLDGGPLLIPESGPSRLRHVYAGDVVKQIVDLLGTQRTYGEVYNLAQYPAPALPDFLAILADLLGGAAPTMRTVTDGELREHGLSPLRVSPFSDPWMSDLENGKAVVELRFRPEGLRHYLDKIVTSFLNHPPAEPPLGYAQRPAEIALAAALLPSRSPSLSAPGYDHARSFDRSDELAEGPPATLDELRRELTRQGIDAATLTPLHSGPNGVVHEFVVPGEQALDTWRTLRAVVATTGHWPVLFGDEEWARRHAGNMQMAEEYHGDTPAQVLAAAAAINVPAWLEQQVDEVTAHYRPPHGAWPDAAAIREALAIYNAHWGAPPDNELDILYQHSFERIADWMKAHGGSMARGLVPLVHVALVPTLHGWQVPAYLNFGGWNEAPKPAEHVAVLKYWGQRHGAELLAMKFDTVELWVRRSPATRDEAMAVAWEYFGYSPDCLPGEYNSPVHSIEGLAAFLLYAKVWGFWWD